MSTRELVLDWRAYTSDPAIHETLLRWTRRHGIDPADVVGDQILEIDDQNRQIRVEVYIRDSNGDITIEGNGEPVTEVRCVQLEAPALPLPDLRPGTC